MDISKVAAVVLNYNNYDDTYECLSSLKKIYKDTLSIYLIDNASVDNSGINLKERFPDCRYIQNEQNLGYAAGNNIAVKKAIEDGYEYILLLNNDVVILHDIIRPLLLKFSMDEEIGVATCKILYKDYPQIINTAGGKLSKLRCGAVNLRIGEKDTPLVEKKYIDFAPGMLLLIKKEVFIDIGYIPEQFFLYFEDIEFSKKIIKKYKIFYTSEVSVLHKSGGGLANKSYSKTYLYYQTRARIWAYKDSSLFYYFYVLLFSLLNTFVKSSIVIKNDKREEIAGKIKVLWKGFLDGVFSNPELTKKADN